MYKLLPTASLVPRSCVQHSWEFRCWVETRSFLSSGVGPLSLQLPPQFNSCNISASSRTLLPVLCLYRSLVLSFPNNIISLWSLPDSGKLKPLCHQQGIKFPFFIRDLKHFFFKKTNPTNTQWGKHSGKLTFFMCRPDTSLPLQ